MDARYWQNFYKEHFGIEINLSALEIPEPQGNFTWLIVTCEQVTEQMLYNKCKELFPCREWTGRPFDQVLGPDATSKGTHIAFFRDRIEADEELKNLSAEDLKERGIQCVTLKQRLVMELDYFSRNFLLTEKHLDIKNVTFCSGSRYSVGRGSVPNVRWDEYEMKVGCCSFDFRADNFRSRQVASFIK